MYLPKLIVTFRDYTDSDFGNRATEILGSLTDNANFPGLQLNALQTAVAEFKAKLAVSGRWFPRVNTFEKNEARELCEKLLKSIAKECMNTAKENIEMLATTGFDLWKKRRPVGTLPKTIIMSATAGPNKGDLTIVAKKIARTTYYEFQLALVTNGIYGKWVSYASTKKSIIISNLTSQSLYAIRVAAAGSNTERIWSDVIDMVIG